jgi:hypothetical protein
MARDRNTFAKRQRETGKKQKAAEKRARRQKRKELSSNLKSPLSGEHPVHEPWHSTTE